MSAREQFEAAVNPGNLYAPHYDMSAVIRAVRGLACNVDALAARVDALEAPAVDAPKAEVCGNDGGVGFFCALPAYHPGWHEYRKLGVETPPKADTPKPTGERMSAERRAEIDAIVDRSHIAAWARELLDELRRVEAELAAARKPRPLSDAAVEKAFRAFDGYDYDAKRAGMRVAIEAADRVRESEKHNATDTREQNDRP